MYSINSSQVKISFEFKGFSVPLVGWLVLLRWPRIKQNQNTTKVTRKNKLQMMLIPCIKNTNVAMTGDSNNAFVHGSDFEPIPTKGFTFIEH